MTTPPDFGGRDIEEGLEEDLGGPRTEHTSVDHHDEYNTVWESNEAHAPDQTCAQCGAAISPLQEVRRRADGTWVHEYCPVP
jgi:hypothetical protein